jgi:hypothetical protein
MARIQVKQDWEAVKTDPWSSPVSSSNGQAASLSSRSQPIRTSYVNLSSGYSSSLFWSCAQPLEAKTRPNPMTATHDGCTTRSKTASHSTAAH